MSDDKYARNLARWEKMVAEECAKRLQEPLCIGNIAQRIMDMQAEIVRLEATAVRVEAATVRMEAETTRWNEAAARLETARAQNQAQTARMQAETAGMQAETARMRAATARTARMLADMTWTTWSEEDDPDGLDSTSEHGAAD